MHERFDIGTVDREARRAAGVLNKYVDKSELDAGLLDLVKLRASGINGCAYCLDLHTREALERGESLQRLAALSAWREAEHLYTDREQAALALTEEVTLIGRAGVRDETWARAAQSFPGKQLVALLLAIACINVWNRMAITTHQRITPR